MSDDIVLTDVEDNVATITINRPDRRNAISNAVTERLIEEFEALSDDDEVHVVVLTGAGDSAFCAGGDLMDQQGGEGMLQMHQERGRFADLLLAMRDCSAPIVSRVNGHALGGGLGLVLASDIAVADEEATLGTPEIKVGLFPMMILAVIQRNLPRKKAMEMTLAGKRWDAETAEEIGIVNYAVESDQLDEKVDELVERINGFSPAILELGRKAFYQVQDMSFEEALRTLHKDLTINALTEDAAEGVMAFVSDREPEWEGK
ncbi:MAG: enoyl-CoA hydratase/isomerase family protein [Bradymonadaceae bacterium]